MVKAVDMAKKYGDFIALHPLNVEVHSGEFFGVFGPNGAGKSTFIKLLTGQLRPSKGQIEILGINAVKQPQKLKSNIGIVPESESPPSYLTPVEFLQFVAKLRDVENHKHEVEYWLHLIHALDIYLAGARQGAACELCLVDHGARQVGGRIFHRGQLELLRSCAPTTAPAKECGEPWTTAAAVAAAAAEEAGEQEQ